MRWVQDSVLVEDLHMICGQVHSALLPLRLYLPSSVQVSM